MDGSCQVGERTSDEDACCRDDGNGSPETDGDGGETDGGETDGGETDGGETDGGETSTPRDPNCNIWSEENGNCIQCSFRFYQAEQCERVSDFCKEWDASNGDCTDCYQRYYLQDG